jgi:hypothetical protein
MDDAFDGWVSVDQPSVGELMQLTVPFAVLVDAAGAATAEGGVIRFQPPPPELKRFPLRLGKHDLGTWVVEGWSATRTRAHEPHTYQVTLRRVA